MIYLDKSRGRVYLNRYLLSEECFEITYQQRVDRCGEVVGTGYLVGREPTRIYNRKGKPSGMARRTQKYAQLGAVKRNRTKI